MPDYDDYKNQISSLIQNTRANPITILNYNFHTIKADASENGLMDLIDGYFSDLSGNDNSIYEERSSFVLISELENFKTGSYKFILDESCYLSNYSSSPSSIEIDFDDGLGFRVIGFGEIIEVEYIVAENKNIRCKINIDGEEKKGGTIINSTGEKAQEIEPTDVPWNELIIEGASQYFMGTTGIANPSELIYANAYTRIEGEFDKPFIFVEGIDFTEPFKNELRNGDFGWDEFASGTNVATEDIDYTFVNDMHFFLQDLIDEGYDIILLDFANGATYIQDNASVLIELINRCNEHKVGDEPLVVAGASMGGQVARYALRYMELNDMDHCTQVYLSLDSPHKGANIPIGLQLFVKIADENIGELEAGNVIDNVLHRPASRQMLLDQMDLFYPNKPSLYNEYYAEIEEMGLPQKTLNYAVSNGNNGGGFLINGTEHFLDYNCNGSSTSDLVNVIMTIRGINSGQPVARFRELHPELTPLTVGIFGWDWFTIENFPTLDYIDDDWSYNYSPNHTRLYDYCPGGTRNSFALLINNINAQLSEQGTCDTVQPWEYELNHSFIPTVSALDIDLSHYSSDIHLTTSELSPFDDTYSPASGNQKHTQVDAAEGGNLEWMLSKVLGNHLNLGNELTSADDNNGVFNIIDEAIKIKNLTVYDGGELHLNTYSLSNFAGNNDVYPEINSHISLDPSSCSNYLTIGNNGILRLGQSGDIPPVSSTLNITDGFVLTVEEGGEMVIDQYSKLIIKRGGLVILNGLTRVAILGKIIVEPGGRLIIDGGTVTSKTNEFWEGIEVQGDASLNQGTYLGDNQGVLIMKNEAIISNAECGIRLAENEELDGWDINWSSTGGIINASNSNFINNRKDVEFLTYHNYDDNDNPIRNKSRFYLCDFKTDDNFYTDDYISANISMFQVDEIHLNGCVFEDLRTDIGRYAKRDGIHTLSSSLIIDEYCTSDCFPCTSSSTCGISSEFKNMRYGIRSYTHANPIFSFKVLKSKFDDCWKGIHLTGIAGADILLNEFNINNELMRDEVNGPVGLYLDNGCTNYKVEENTFVGDDSESGVSVGIVVHNGHDVNTDIYKNSFQSLSVATETLGQNRASESDDYTGLFIQCNDFTENVADVYVTQQYNSNDEISGLGISQHQGELSTDASQHANNKFINTDYTDWNCLNEGEFIFYVTNNLDPSHIMDTSLYNSSTLNQTVLIEDVLTNTSYCPSNFSVKTLYQTNIEKSIALGGLIEKQFDLDQFVDGGNTTALEMDVIQTDNSDAWIKYQELMSNAGYLSEEVLKEVSKKEDGFTQGMIRNVLVANPKAAKSKEITKELDERMNPLPNFMREQIKLGLTQVSAIEYLQLQKAGYKRKFDKAIDESLKIIAGDSLMPNKTNEIINWLSNTHDINWDYQLVDFYDNNGMEEYGDLLLSIMESDYELSDSKNEELERFIAFRELINTWEQTAINVSSLSDNQIIQLEEYTFGSNITAARAKGLLFFNNMLNYIPPIVLPTENNDKNMGINSKKEVISNGKLEVSPNPSVDFFSIHYLIAKPFKAAVAHLMDNNGNLVRTIPITNEEDELLIPTQSISKGSYQLIIMVDGAVYLKKTVTLI